jgi:hypothetical protein
MFGLSLSDRTEDCPALRSSGFSPQLGWPNVPQNCPNVQVKRRLVPGEPEASTRGLCEVAYVHSVGLEVVTFDVHAT